MVGSKKEHERMLAKKAMIEERRRVISSLIINVEARLFCRAFFVYVFVALFS
jgi:hypothetical protein